MNRRSALAVGGMLTISVGTVAALGSATGCASGPTNKTEDPAIGALRALIEGAQHDADAAAAAAASTPTHSAELRVVADERRRHAQVLRDELARSTPTTTSTQPSTSVQSSPQQPPPTLSTVIAGLRSSGRATRALAITSTGYRAGLLASISAAINAEVQEQLT